MFSKIFPTLAAGLALALAGCGGAGGGAGGGCTFNNVAVPCANFDEIQASVDNWNAAVAKANTTQAVANARMDAARAARSASAVAAAQTAVAEFEAALQAVLAAAERERRAGAPVEAHKAQSLANTRSLLSQTREWKTELDRLGSGGQSARPPTEPDPDTPNGDRSGNSGTDNTARPKDFDTIVYYLHATDGLYYPQGSGGDLYLVDLTCNFDNCGQGVDEEFVVGEIFNDGRLRDSYLPLATINAVNTFISNQRVRTGQYAGHVKRNIAAWGRYAAILSTGTFDCPRDCSRSGKNFGFDFGNTNLNVPSLSGSWAGAMAATDITTGSAVVGEAYVAFDSSIFGHDTGRYKVGVKTPPDVTLRFRNIREIDDRIDGQTRAYSGPTQIDWELETTTRFGWFGIPSDNIDGNLVTYGFGRGDIAHPTLGIVRGQFYGPTQSDAQEVAGVFEYYYGGKRLQGNRRKEGLVGAFLAKRR